ncbi:MAG: hypothetical protein NW217_15955 [Hyphomicrobiaceae bacterium]|nr:hypothetical protein [Hyphomicrobiaceae bacterium]
MPQSDIMRRPPGSPTAAALLRRLIVCALLLLPTAGLVGTVASAPAEARVLERIVSKSRTAIRKSLRHLRYSVARHRSRMRTAGARLARTVTRAHRSLPTRSGSTPRSHRPPKFDGTPCCEPRQIDEAPTPAGAIINAAVPPLPSKQPRPWHATPDGSVLVAAPTDPVAAGLAQPPTAASLDGRLFGGIVLNWTTWPDLGADLGTGSAALADTVPPALSDVPDK